MAAISTATSVQAECPRMTSKPLPAACMSKAYSQAAKSNCNIDYNSGGSMCRILGRDESLTTAKCLNTMETVLETIAGVVLIHLIATQVLLASS